MPYGSAGGGGYSAGVSAHASLTGLSADDHAQYALLGGTAARNAATTAFTRLTVTTLNGAKVATALVADCPRTGSTAGATNNAAALQAFINGLSTGDVAIIPPGVYGYGTAPKWRDDITLIMYGAKMRILNATNVDIWTSGNYPAAGGGSRFTMIGGEWDGNVANNTNNGSGVMLGVSDVRLIGVTVHDGDGSGIFFSQSTNVSLDNCVTYGMGADGISAYNGCARFSAVQCISYSNVGHGYLYMGREQDGQAISTDARFIACIAYSNTLNGFYLLNGVERVTLVACHSSSNSAKGFDIYTANAVGLTTSQPNKNVLLDSCQAWDNAADEGVKVWDGGTAGHGARDITIRGGRYFDNGAAVQGYGIVVQSLADYVFIDGADVRGNVNGGIEIGAGVNPNGRIGINPGNTGRYVSTGANRTLATYERTIRTTAAGVVITLAAAANLDHDDDVRIKNTSGGDITVQRAGADTIYDTASVTSITVPAGESRTLKSDGTSLWLVV